MIKITKYIQVKVNLEKIIPVEEDDLNKALEKAKEIFYEKELTSEYLNSRDVNFSEFTNIKTYSKMLADIITAKYGTNLTEEQVQEHFYSAWNRDEYTDFMYDEVLKILEKDYDMSFKKINI